MQPKGAKKQAMEEVAAASKEKPSDGEMFGS
jgi:hypothetical protein